MNHTTMKATAVISEAWRSITSGAARLAPAVLALALTAAGMGVMDIAAGSTILDQASAYRQSGADILVLNAPDGIDAASCERLTSLTNVQAAGAIRTTDPLTLAALPDTTTPLYQITPGLAKLLDTKQDPNTTGLIASQQVAETLGTSTGGTIGLADGRTARVKGIYQYPDDGRTPGYAYALMEETPATGTFDACWAKTWPQTDRTRNAYGPPSPRTRKPPATMHPPSASSTPPKATASTDKPSTGNAPHASCPPAAHSSPSPSDTCSYAADGSKSPPHCIAAYPNPHSPRRSSSKPASPSCSPPPSACPST